MRTCPACSRQYEEDVTVCPVDGEPLGAVTVAAVPPGDPDPETEVRPRRAQPIPQPRFTEISLERPAPSSPPDAVVRPTGIPDRVYRESSPWPTIAAVTAVVAIAVAVLVYFVSSRNSDLATEVSAQITEARVAVADAKARLESLPPESPLRQRLLALQQWDRELQALELSGERTRESASRAREIAAQARSIGEDARVAGATLPTTPPVVPPAVEPAPGEELGPPSTNMSAEPGDAGTEPDAVEPPTNRKPTEPPPPADTPATPPGEDRRPDDAPAVPEPKPSDRDRKPIPSEPRPPAPTNPDR
jgi:hypothetical protein